METRPAIEVCVREGCAKLCIDETIFGQVHFIGEDEIAGVADAVKKAWEETQK